MGARCNPGRLYQARLRAGGGAQLRRPHHGDRPACSARGTTSLAIRSQRARPLAGDHGSPHAGRSRCLRGHCDCPRRSQPGRAHRHVEGLSMGTGKLFHFTQSGLDNVWLANGWRVTKTPYGPSFSIERLDGLHEALARFIVESPLPMRGQDARYLRVMLDLSQADMGKLLGVSRATVIRWENAAKAPLDRVHDIAVRATYAAH